MATTAGINYVETIIIGAGAAGLFCAGELAKQGKKSLILDNGKKAGRKILMSGGGFCNFTNLDVSPEHYLSHNPHFVKSALARFNQWDFISLIAEQGIPYHEKEKGQLFCDQSAEDIVQWLLSRCPSEWVSFQFRQQISEIKALHDQPHVRFQLTANGQLWQCYSLVIASGGLSMPALGASPFGYQIAEQFGHQLVPPRAGLVPFTWREKEKYYTALSGISLPVLVKSQGGQSFQHHLLFTHRGLSGPAMLQISNYWQPNEALEIDLLPNNDVIDYLQEQRQKSPKIQLKTALSRLLPTKLVELWFEQKILTESILADLTKLQLKDIEQFVHHWQIIPNGTEGYRTAEVTLGGVNTEHISSKTMESQKQKGLYFIGEVLDVTGWLGGYNFQWAWSSAYACAKGIAEN